MLSRCSTNLPSIFQFDKDIICDAQQPFVALEKHSVGLSTVGGNASRRVLCCGRCLDYTGGPRLGDYNLVLHPEARRVWICVRYNITMLQQALGKLQRPLRSL